MAKRNNSEGLDVQSLPQRITPLDDYRAAIASLRDASEKLATLRVVRSDLEGQLTSAEADRETGLVRASEVGEELSLEQSDELVRASTRVEILRRKVLEVTHRLEAAESDRIALVTQTAQRFSSLWRAFRLWTVEREVERLKAGLAAPCDGNLLAVVANCSHAVVAAKKLDIVLSDDAEALMAGAGKLLEAVSSTTGFTLPAWQPSTPISASPQEEPPGLPWLGRGMTAREIEEEFARIRLEDPALDYSAAYRVMRQRHPQLFSPPSQTEPVFETPKQEWKVPMIGDTVPV